MRRWTLVTLLIWLAALAVFPASFPVSAQQDENGTLQVDGIERTYYLHVPASYDGTSPVPLIVALHPAASSGRAMALLTGLDAAADEDGFIVAYPNTSGPAWGEDASDPDASDDASFIPALIDDLAATYTIDTANVSLVGWGSGGLMAYRLACEVPERFKSVAVVGALMWERHREACPASPAALVNMLIVHGTDDPFFTRDTHIYESLSDSVRYTILGVDDTLSFWALRSGCDLTAALIERNTTLFPDCGGGTRIALYAVQGARSNWPRTGPYQLNQFGVDASEMITRFLAGGDDWAVEQPPFEGQARTYAVYVPSSYDPAEPLPVVITLHGRFGSGAGTAGYTRMNEIAEREGFIGLYPDGLLNPGATYPYDTGWNYMLGSPYTKIMEPDDGAFITTLLDDLALDLNIDQQRIYVDGLSNGGFMVHNLACNYPDRFAAFGTVAASAYFSIEETCNHTTPVSMVIIHGTADDNIPWDGRTEMVNGQPLMISYPVLDTLAFWTVHDGCDPDAIEEGEIPPGGQSPETLVRTLTLSDCPGGAELQLYGIVGGGHNWPGIYDEDATWVNPRQVNMDINAGEVLWEFFSRHSLSTGS